MELTLSLPDSAVRELQRLPRHLTTVEERLAACAQVSPVGSIYRWKDKVEEVGEWVCQLKTTPERIEALTARVLALHSYEVPEIITVPVLTGHPPYLQWVADSVGEV